MNMKNCPKCGGKTRSEALGWICENCHGLIDMQGKFHEHIDRPFMPPMTNGDRLRAMRDNELAFYLCELLGGQGCDETKCPGYYMCNTRDGRANGLVKWLKQTEEEDVKC